MGFLYNQIPDLAASIIQGKSIHTTLFLRYNSILTDTYHWNLIGCDFDPRDIILYMFFLPSAVLSSAWKLGNWRWRSVGSRDSKKLIVISNILIFRMIPFSLGGALVSICAGIIVSRVGRYRPIIWFAWATMILGYGLMTMLDNNSSKCVYVL
jgi:hypothetical protein